MSARVCRGRLGRRSGDTQCLLWVFPLLRGFAGIIVRVRRAASSFDLDRNADWKLSVVSGPRNHQELIAVAEEAAVVFYCANHAARPKGRRGRRRRAQRRGTLARKSLGTSWND